ncbi:MAG: cyclic pyranopterin monophosphate synthase MoaC [Candidatus Verstraetearchaeota archaeon]|nr:cyclic pyranopterin monophosphate synthase MoaC [Candidatus Verstraetearchaeota archaeon]
MVDISSKDVILREATAYGEIKLKKETLSLVAQGKIAKGDVFTVAQIAGINAAKKTAELLPLCHPLSITKVDVQLGLKEGSIYARATVKATAKTGVEMEALTAVSAALLTVWDMVKQYEKDDRGQYPSTAITSIIVERKMKGEPK